MAKFDRSTFSNALMRSGITITRLVVPKELKDDPEGFTRWCDDLAIEVKKMKGEPVKSIAGGKIVNLKGERKKKCPLFVVSTMRLDEISQKIALKPMVFH